MKKLFAALLALCMVFSLSAVALAEDTVNVYALKGPTGIGMVQIMAENDGTYAFTLAGAPDEVVAAVASGNADIAAVPTNLAATLNKKTNGNVQLLALRHGGDGCGLTAIIRRGGVVYGVTTRPAEVA